MRHLIFWTTLTLLSSCSTADKDLVQYKDGRQILNLNGLTRNGDKLDEFDVDRILTDSVSIGEEFLAKIYLTDKNIKLVAAYFDCQTVDDATVDTVVSTLHNYNRLDGCRKGLMVKNDTIYIAFRPETPGKKTFDEITILNRDKESTFRTQKYSFEYTVVEN
jgi:hypothetical protein